MCPRKQHQSKACKTHQYSFKWPATVSILSESVGPRPTQVIVPSGRSVKGNLGFISITHVHIPKTNRTKK